MIGELLAGLILGPPLLGLVAVSEPLILLADFGIFFAMFYAGMELDPKELLEHFAPSLVTAVGGFVLPYLLGMGVALIFGGTVFQSLVVGLGVSISAVAVQSVILQSLKINRTDVGHIMIGAAILQDIAALIGLSLLLGFAEQGSFVISEMLWLLLKVALFFGMTVAVGEFVMPRLTRRMKDQLGASFTFAILVALAMAKLAELAGLHLIIGAFLAGQFVRRDIMNEKIYEMIADRFYGISYGFLVPIFFATLAFHLSAQWTSSFWIFALVLCFVAVAGKVLGGGLAMKMFGFGYGEAMAVGFGMNGRGAVELVVASVIMQLSRELSMAGAITVPLLTEEQFSALVLVAFVTTIMAPLTLRWVVSRTCLADEHKQFCRMMKEAPRK